MHIQFYGLVFETPRVTFYLWTPWRAAALEHRLFESIQALPGSRPETVDDGIAVSTADPKTFKAALQAISRVLKGWQEEADAGAGERRFWRWLLEGDVNEYGYDEAGEQASLWALLQVRVEHGGPAEAGHGETVDLDGFGLRIWPEKG